MRVVERGCWRKMINRKSIAGQKFGKWFVIERVYLDKPNTHWLCECECGNKKIVQRGPLTKGESQSCGCLRNPTVKEKILSNIDIDSNGCWNWKGALQAGGYGRVRFRGKYMPLHRASYIIFKGDIPEDKLACHTCDNRKCVNPDHIYVGTYESNNRDTRDRKRCNPRKGIDHHSAIFDEYKVKVIRFICNNGFSQSSVAKFFNVRPGTISKIIRRERWAHI